MKISISDPDGFHMNIRLPSALAFNSVTALLIPRIMEKNGVVIDRKQAVQFLKAINDYRRSHPEWALVDVEESDGRRVTIKI